MADLRIGSLENTYKKALVDISEIKENSKMHEEMKNDLLEIMENRLKWIEETIDMHVANLV